MQQQNVFLPKIIKGFTRMNLFTDQCNKSVRRSFASGLRKEGAGKDYFGNEQRLFVVNATDLCNVLFMVE